MIKIYLGSFKCLTWQEPSFILGAAETLFYIVDTETLFRMGDAETLSYLVDAGTLFYIYSFIFEYMDFKAASLGFCY